MKVSNTSLVILMIKKKQFIHSPSLPLNTVALFKFLHFTRMQISI